MGGKKHVFSWLESESTIDADRADLNVLFDLWLGLIE